MGYDNLKVGDRVYDSNDLWRRKHASFIRTIERATHNGQRLVLDDGTVILARNQREMGRRFGGIWRKYTPEVQAEWDAEDRWRDMEARLTACHIDSRRYRYFPMDALVEIAEVCEKHQRAYAEAHKPKGVEKV